MDAKLKRKWVKALLSGEYQQAHKHLVTKNGAMCCLGVLRHCVDPSDDREDEDEQILSGEQAQEFGLTYKEQIELAEINDAGVPFDMIAGLIDEAL